LIFLIKTTEREKILPTTAKIKEMIAQHK